MKRSLYFLAILALLPACSSGGSQTPPVIPTATPTPIKTPTAYTVSLKVSGGAMGTSYKDMMRHPMSGTTPEPLQMTAPDSTDPLAGGGTGASGVNMYVQAQVAPSPSAIPPVTYSATNPSIQVSPGPTPAPGSTDIQPALLTVKTPTQDASGSFTATVGGTINTAITRQLIIYPGMTLYATVGGNTPSNEYPGYTVTGGHVVGTYDVAHSDIWVDMASNSIRTPYGSTLVSNANSLASLTASQWAASNTTVTYAQTQTRNSDLSLNNILLLKGSDGTVCEYMAISWQGGAGLANAYVNGPVQCHGTSINGF